MTLPYVTLYDNVIKRKPKEDDNDKRWLLHIRRICKKANVTLRTIRYYDRQGILKPSKVADNGYRLYTDADFAKLQKILSLKYLGFSLEEIMTMTINDEDQDFIKESISLQLYLVQKKMEHLKLVEQSLEEMEQRWQMKRKLTGHR